jgi:hypothetical protein
MDDYEVMMAGGRACARVDVAYEVMMAGDVPVWMWRMR